MDIRNPSSFPRRILVCVSGLSPQILTETVYTLVVNDTRQPFSFVPTEIHLITTVEGACQAKLSLLEPGNGQFYALCADYGLDPAAIRFDDSSFHLISAGDGRNLDDIRSEADNVAAADTITAVVRELTADPEAAVHASIAGGRKTMGFFLGYAMSLFARPQDRLSHVLVSSPFESHKEFFFPPRTSRVLDVGRQGSPRLVSTKDAEITLADIPFVRLRDSLERTLLSDGARYGETVRRAQAGLEPVELVLDPESCRIRCASQVLQLDKAEFAFYAWFARRAQAGLPGLHWSEADAGDYLAEYARLVNPHSGEYVRTEEALRQGITKEYFEPRLSKLNRFLNRALGPGPAAPYRIGDDGLISGTRYRRKVLGLRPEQVRFGVVEEN